jgi:hypothetical protein
MLNNKISFYSLTGTYSMPLAFALIGTEVPEGSVMGYVTEDGETRVTYAADGLSVAGLAKHSFATDSWLNFQGEGFADPTGKLLLDKKQYAGPEMRVLLVDATTGATTVFADPATALDASRTVVDLGAANANKLVRYFMRYEPTRYELLELQGMAMPYGRDSVIGHIGVIASGQQRVGTTRYDTTANWYVADGDPTPKLYAADNGIITTTATDVELTNFVLLQGPSAGKDSAIQVLIK